MSVYSLLSDDSRDGDSGTSQDSLICSCILRTLQIFYSLFVVVVVNGYLTNNWLIPPTAIWHQVDMLLKLLINDTLVISSYFNSQLAVRCYWVNASACATLAIVSYVE